MQVTNKDTYSNCTYNAIIVNSNTDQDPDNQYRVQIFIPSLQFEYCKSYEEYMNSADKTSHTDFNKYPWAKSLIPDLEEGNVVYVNYINNDCNQYVVLGLDAYNPINKKSKAVSGNIDGMDVLSMAMPIIIHNEVGISVENWPDGISDSQYTNINPYDYIDTLTSNQIKKARTFL